VATYDAKRELSPFYAPVNRDWELVTVPAQRFIAIDGTGDPNTSPLYTESVQALYAVAYSMKFASKLGLDRDFVVAPLEGLWYADDASVFATGLKSSWNWTMMISHPDWVTDAVVRESVAAAAAKKRLAAITRVRMERLDEGLSAQVLHIGSYDEEGPILARLHTEFLPAAGVRPSGRHHEIYLGDPRTTEPSRLKTVLRQPVAPA